MDTRLTHEDSLGFLKDLLERLASYRGKLWLEAGRRFLTGRSTDFYMLEVGQHGSARFLLEAYTQAGFSTSPMSGTAFEALRACKPQQCSGQRECLKLLPVRAMDFERTSYVPHKTKVSAIEHIAHMERYVTTSWEAACNLLLETAVEKEGLRRNGTLLGLSPSPIVWTFVGGNHESRYSFADNKKIPILVGLVSEDAGLGFKGIAEAEYLWRKMGRTEASPLPSDVFAFSYNTTNL